MRTSTEWSGGPFAYRVTAKGAVRVFRGGREVAVLGVDASRRLLARIEGAPDAEAQQQLARATGNYRRGNERGGR